MIFASLPSWVEPTARFMLEGLKLTVEIAAVAVVASTVIGIVLGVLLTVRFRPLQALIRLYVEVWRGLPIIVTIFIVYFGFPTIADVISDSLPSLADVANRLFRLNPAAAATVALSLWGSAQVAEATRGAVQSIPREQHEAASALGFGWVGRQTFVVLPQAFRRLLPPLVTLLVGVIQNTTLASLIGAGELLFDAQKQVERLQAPPPAGINDGHQFAIYGSVLVIFFLISFPLTRLAAFLERRLA